MTMAGAGDADAIYARVYGARGANRVTVEGEVLYAAAQRMLPLRRLQRPIYRRALVKTAGSDWA